MRLIFTFAGGSGHFYPLVPVANAALDAGHIIIFACSPSQVDTIVAEGFDVIPLATQNPSAANEERPLRPLDDEREAQEFVAGFLGDRARRRFENTKAAIEDWKPDCLVCDETDFGSVMAAEAAGVLCSTVIVLASGTFPNSKVLRANISNLRKCVGLVDDSIRDLGQGDSTLAPVPVRFQSTSDRSPINSFIYCPPFSLNEKNSIQHLFPEHLAWPVVYVTLGTVFNLECGDLFERILDGLHGLPLNVLLTCGPHIDPDRFGKTPSNVLVKQFMSQDSILPHVALMISHGGSGSVLGALLHGVPSVIIPLGADQPHNARRCEYLDCALTLDPISATCSDIRNAITEVLTNHDYRSSAEDLMRDFRKQPSVAEAIELLERLVTKD